MQHRSADLDDWEVPYRQIKETGEKLGSGSFGDVVKVTWRGKERAFKTLRGGGGSGVQQEQVKKAMREARFLKQAQHTNVIGLVGVCVEEGRAAR